MATINFTLGDDTNLRDINGNNITDTITYAVFLGNPGSFTEYQSGSASCSDGEMAITGVTSPGTHTVILTYGSSLGAYSMTAN